MIPNWFGKKVRLYLNLGLMPNSDVLIKRVSRWNSYMMKWEMLPQTLLGTLFNIQYACHVTLLKSRPLQTRQPLQPYAVLVALGRGGQGAVAWDREFSTKKKGAQQCASSETGIVTRLLVCQLEASGQLLVKLSSKDCKSHSSFQKVLGRNSDN